MVLANKGMVTTGGVAEVFVLHLPFAQSPHSQVAPCNVGWIANILVVTWSDAASLDLTAVMLLR
jgi:hypothetical protein